ncbi:PEGA domain-containing protein [bacterium]|nr:MAG: PEGA domain-containing protein [bacterium]
MRNSLSIRKILAGFPGVCISLVLAALLVSAAPGVAQAKAGSIFGDDTVVAGLKLMTQKAPEAAGSAPSAPPPAAPPPPPPKAPEAVKEAPPPPPPPAQEAPKTEAAPAAEEKAPPAAEEAAAPAPVPAPSLAPASSAAMEERREADAAVAEEIAEEEAPRAGGTLVVESSPEGIKVFIDGEELGVTPIAVEGLADSPHEIILFHPQKGAFSQMVESGSGRIFIDLSTQGGLGVGFLNIETTPSNVRIDLDGKRLGLSPVNQPVVSGKHKVLLSKDGYVDREFTVEVKAGATQAIKETLEEKAGALLIIVTPTGGKVFLDGNAVGVADAPLRIADVPAGIHEIRVDKEGFIPWSRNNVKVTREKTETILASLQAQRSEAAVRIFTDPEGARVWLDGKELGVAGPEGVGFVTEKGTHVLKMELNPAITAGYRPLQVSVSFTEDSVDYQANPIKLPVIDEAYLSAQKVFEAGKDEEAISFLDRVDPAKASYPESRIMMIRILQNLRRTSEIPAEFEKLFSQPIYKKNPVLNLGMGYWAIQAAKQAGKGEGSDYLSKGIDALDRCVESVDYFPADERQSLALKAHYYTGIASELLFGLTNEKKYVKKGVQAWEMFFARLNSSEETLGTSWIEKAKKHQKNLSYLEKKLGR